MIPSAVGSLVRRPELPKRGSLSTRSSAWCAKRLDLQLDKLPQGVRRRRNLPEQRGEVVFIAAGSTYEFQRYANDAVRRGPGMRHDPLTIRRHLEPGLTLAKLHSKVPSCSRALDLRQAQVSLTDKALSPFYLTSRTNFRERPRLALAFEWDPLPVCR